MRLWLSLILSLLLFGCVQPLVAVQAQVSAADQATRQELEQQLKDVEAQIAQYEQQLTQIKGEKNTLNNKIKQLKSKQASLNLQIKATNLQITKLDGQINDTQFTIAQNQAQRQTLQEQLAMYLRLLNQRDGYPYWYTLVAGGKLSDVFTDAQAYGQLTSGLGNVLTQAQRAKNQLDQQVQTLTSQQDQAQNLLSVKLLQQQDLVDSVKEQNTLLQQTKGKETNYQNVLNDTKKQAAEIRSRIYQLLGVSTQITFGQAVQIAQWVSGQTGVRPAYLLAILTQESNLGKNVGTCNRPSDPPEKSWRVIMKPDRDQVPFQQITKELGMNPDVTPVSCPMKDKNGKQLGWGGAMGPAQFIPSTWMGYRDRVAAASGKPLANPWDIRDAFLAAAILLKGNGANGTPAGERNAALRYFSGGTNSAYSFYADSVAALADKYETDIKTLGQ